MESKKGQVTIFIIIAIVVVAAVGLYFLTRNSVSQGVSVPTALQPVYNNFLTCLQDYISEGISVLESQGGYIYLPDFEPGSQYMPFGSQLNFLGNPIPYWYYVSGNNIEKEQVPTKSDLETQLANFLDEKISGCNFGNYYEQGFEISLRNPSASVSISDSSVSVDLNAELTLTGKGESVLLKNHKSSVSSDLGTLYDSATTVYNDEQKNLFLENYGIDVLRLYAPVDGVDITCSPEVWNADEVFDNLQNAIEQNTAALKSVGGKDYFDAKLPVGQEVRFLNSKNWPNALEVSPSEGSLLLADPVGNQEGLGIIGFCYVPYHFVYSVKYPVLIQVYSESGEIFQFPTAVVIQGNSPREALNVTAVDNIVPELCQYKNSEIQVNVRNKQGMPLQANVSYDCFGNTCNIGETSESGVLQEGFPQCANGYVLASAQGYKTGKYLFSTVDSGSVDVLLDKLYTKPIQLKLDGVNYNGDAIINFISDDTTRVVPYPAQKIVELSEGQYKVQVYIYKNSSLTLGATTKQQCVQVPRGSVLGALGLTQEKCFDVQIPEQLISNVLSGGGTQNYYMLESELNKQNSIEINTESLPTPKSIDELQNNYLLFDANGLEVSFK